MKLKLLFAPLMTILIAYLIIQWVIPAYFGATGVKATNENLEKINVKVADIEEKNANAAELVNALNYNANQQVIIRQYLPEERKDEEIISTLSSAASKDSISISSIAVKSDQSAPAISEEVLNPVTANSSDNSMVTDMVDTSNENLLKRFDVEVNVIGGYAGIKNFIVDLTTLKRFNKIASLKITANAENAELFTANISVTFDYLNKITSVLNVDRKIFADKNFDMSIVTNIESKTSTNVSTVNIGDLGRANPFAL